MVGGPLAALYSVTHPAKGEVLEVEWREEVSRRLNSFEEALPLLTKSIVLSEDAAFLGKWIAENSESGGRSDSVDYDNIVASFPDATKIEMLEAVGNLEIEQMVVVSRCLGKPFMHLRPTHKLFEVFDPIVFDNVNPREDAATIAEELLNTESGVSAADLCEKFGWDIRRVNPALAIVGEFIGDGRKSMPLGGPFVIRYMSVDIGERVKLRRFLAEVRGN